MAKPGPVGFSSGLLLRDAILEANGKCWIRENQEIVIYRDSKSFQLSQAELQTFQLQQGDFIEVWWRDLKSGQPGQVILLIFAGVPKLEKQRLDGHYPIDKDGMLRLPLLEEKIKAIDLSGKELSALIVARYREAGVYPNITAEAYTGITDASENIFVSGIVADAGLVEFKRQMALEQAILHANRGSWLAGDYQIMVYRDGKILPVDRQQETSKKFILRAGDVVEVRGKWWHGYRFPADAK